MKQRMLYSLVTCIAGLILMVLITACAGVGSTPNGNSPITGPITSVDRVNHSIIVNAGGQPITIKGLTDQEVTVLQNQVGKVYTIQATQQSDGSYVINPGTTPQAQENTPEANQTSQTNQTPVSQGVNEPGNISFTGTVQSVGNGSIVVRMPDGSTLPMIMNAQTNLSGFNGTQPGSGQLIKVEATANASDGSFTAMKLKPATAGSSDQYVADYQGVTTSAVGPDHFIHFKIGNRSFSFLIASTADLGDFNGNAQGIQNNQTVKVKVQFQGSTGTATKVSTSNG